MKIAPLPDHEMVEFQSLIGKTVQQVYYINEDEGIYVIEFTDGVKASFTSRGDDMTYTSFELE